MTENRRHTIWLDWACFGLVLALSALSARAFFKPAPPPRAPRALSRSPASFQKEASAKEHSTSVVEFNCEKPKSALSTEASLLRIVSQLCPGMALAAAKNETTGENLILFAQRDKVSTHYFPLKKGTNRIEMEWKGKNSRNVQTLEINRI
jgi:hypothetical protein